MTLSAEDIKGLIAGFNASDWDEMALTAGDVSIVISRAGGSQWVASALASANGATATGSPAAETTSPAPADHGLVTAVPVPLPVKGGPPEVIGADRPHLTQRVTSPSVGLFWRSPQPGSPPFVEVGQRVAADDTVCIIEVMKLMSHVKAGRAGTVSSIETENGALVEHGTLLMFLEPDD